MFILAFVHDIPKCADGGNNPHVKDSNSTKKKQQPFWIVKMKPYVCNNTKMSSAWSKTL